MANAKWACGPRRSIAPRRLLLLIVQVLGLAVLISLLMRVLFGRSKGSSHLGMPDMADESHLRNAGSDPAAISAAAPPLSSQNPWRANTSKQKGGNSPGTEGGEKNIFEGDTDTGVGNENDKDEDNEAYMPAHLSELLVRDGVPKQAPGPQSF